LRQQVLITDSLRNLAENRYRRVKFRIDFTAVIQRDVSSNIPAGRLQLRGLRFRELTTRANDTRCKLGYRSWRSQERNCIIR